ncbi:MAG: endonuclease NucS domain-containing protein, partial [Mycobacteriaceae bacterium]
SGVALEIDNRVDVEDSDAVPPARYVAVEIKRRANIDAVEQLTRYLELLNRDTSLAPVSGVLAAQMIAPQARTLAEDRGIRCVVVDYNALRGMTVEGTLF